MILPAYTIEFVDIVGSTIILFLASLSMIQAWKWYRKKQESIFRHYIALLTASFVVFAISRSVGHLIKHVLISNEMTPLWKQIAPFSGSVNTATFIIIFAISIYFHRSRKTHEQIKHHKEHLEETVAIRSAELEEKSSFLENTFESLNHPFYVIDPKTYKVLMANKASKFNFRHGETCYSLAHQRNTPCDSNLHPCPIKEILQTKKPFMTEHIHHHSDNTIGIFEVHAYPILDQEGNVDKIIEYSRNITDRKKDEEKIKVYAEVQKTLLREVNHRVKNNLAAIISMLYMEEEKLKGKESHPTLTILNDVIARIKSLATAHSLLSASKWQPLSLNYLCNEIINGAFSASPESKKIAVVIQPTSIQIDSTKAHNLALVINELATNTIKHALEENILPEIHVSFDQTDEDGDVLINICYQDNGPGYPQEIVSGDYGTAHIGVELIHGIITTTLGGTVEFSNDEGAVTRFSFKKHHETKHSQAEV